jgi:hypothetical protein
VMDMHTIGECCSSRLKKLSSLLQLPSEIQPSRMSESERRADGPAAGGLGRTPESKGPTTPASALVPAGGMGEDAAQELLDWGSIEDEDGAFGQLSTAGKLQVQDSATSEALLPGGGHASAGGKLANGAGDAGAINPPAQPCAADVNTMSLGGMLLASGGIQGELAAAAAGCAAQGILQNGDLGLHGAPESSTGQAYAAERTNASQAEAAVDPLVDVEPPRLGALQGSVPDLSGSRGSAGPLPEGTPPNTSVQGSDQRAQPGIAERATIDNDGTEATCDAGRAINASGATAGATAAETAAKAGTRGHDTGKVTQQLPRNRFIASELHRPEAPYMPIRGATRGSRSYCEAVRSRPPPARINVRPYLHQSRAASQGDDAANGSWCWGAPARRPAIKSRSPAAAFVAWARITSSLSVETHSIAWPVAETVT